MPTISYDAPPTIARFMQSEAFGRIIAGPVGSGKTTGCLFELLRRACEQEPAEDGLRYTRFAIVRQTLKQLRDTVLKDVTSWLAGIAEWKVSEMTIHIRIGDVRSEWPLIPLDNQEDQARLLSMQLTGAWMSEAIEMDIELIKPLSGRIGRYPAGRTGVATWKGIIADTNMPTEGSPWHKFMEDAPADWQIFRQPSGLAEDAENLDNLVQNSITTKLPIGHPDRVAKGREYYDRFIRMHGEDAAWVTRYVKAEYGPDPSGTAVFRESFKRSFHVVTSETEYAIDPVPGYTIVVAQDFGRDPCSLICQPDHKGRLLVLEEVIAEDIGLELHVQRALRPALLKSRYLGKTIAMVGDPAGKAKSTIYEETSFDALLRFGYRAFPAPTNDLDPRLRAVEALLGAQRDGGPALLIDGNKCPKLVLALSGGYRYAKTKQGQRKPLPDKNEYSHIADCLQYACLVFHGGQMTDIARQMRPRVPNVRPRISAAAWT